MKPASIIELAAQDGVLLALSDTGNVKATGDQGAVNRWLQTIREHKQGIVEALHNDGQQQNVPTKLEAMPGTHYAIHVKDAVADPVIVTVAIRGVAVFDLAIPHQYYDGLVLLELIADLAPATSTNFHHE